MIEQHRVVGTRATNTLRDDRNIDPSPCLATPYHSALLSRLGRVCPVCSLSAQTGTR